MSDTESNSFPPFLVSEEEDDISNINSPAGGSGGGYKYRDFGNLTEEEIESSSSRPPSPAPTNAPSSRNGNGNVSNSNSNINMGSSIRVQRFPVKLYAILAQPEFKEIITWMPHGRSWKVLKPNLFESLVMPLFFEYRNYHSFNRLINAWSFRRISSGPDRGSYYHELFLRGMPLLHKHMRRLPKTHKKLNMNKQDEPDFYKMDATNPLPQLKETDRSFLNNHHSSSSSSSSSPSHSPMMLPTSMVAHSSQQQGSMGNYSFNGGIMNDCKFDTSRDALYGSLGQGFHHQQKQQQQQQQQQLQQQQSMMNGYFDTTHNSNSNNMMGMNMNRMSSMHGMNHVTTMNGIQNLRGGGGGPTSILSSSSDFDTPFGNSMMMGSSARMMMMNNSSSTIMPQSSSSLSLSSSPTGMLDTYQLQKQQQKHLRQLQQMQMLERQMGATATTTMGTSAFEPAWFQ
jgi:HSF-type DNA-binding